MKQFHFSTHARQQMNERGIQETWVWHTLEAPDLIEFRDDDNMHYMKTIDEFGGRVLRVVVNEDGSPHKIVTIFFDRQLTKEWKS